MVVIGARSSEPWSPLQAPKELVNKFSRDPLLISLASTDFGHIIHENPFAIFAPSTINDISNLIKFSNSLPFPFTIAARGQAHSLQGQSMTNNNGIVVNMTELNRLKNGVGIVVSEEKSSLGYYADVGGEQIWIDVLHATLERGLTPLSWTDYLFLSVGGTLSNAGISGQSFRFGPQISNVHELDVVTDLHTFILTSTGNGDMVKYLRLIYNKFSAFTGDQEHLISLVELNESNAPDYLEGLLLLNQQPLDISFYPEHDQPRVTSLVTQFGILYVIELVKYYDNNTQEHIDEDVNLLVKDLKFVPTFMFQKDVTYEEFLNRVHPDELNLRSEGLWDVPHPWLNLFVPRSRILDFDEGVFKGIILKQNITAGVVLVYPMNRSK
ncbi:unnamed protein product [Lupinus luteus]|uniref:cytokinin dehydrogenase n=1 Tax=Lupinus luteus TaxID=3873 RepID=A0AAV1XW46_LUPLU